MIPDHDVAFAAEAGADEGDVRNRGRAFAVEADG